MTVEIQYDASTAVSFRADLVATSASLAVVKPDGTTQETAVVVLPTVSTTVGAGTTATVLTLAAVTSIVPGMVLQVTSDGVVYECEAAVIDAAAKTVALVVGLPVVPDTGGTVKAVGLTSTIAAPGAANIGSNWRLVWTYSDGTTTKIESEAAAVVRQRWVSPIGADDVRGILAEMNTARSEQWNADVASKVDDEMRATVESIGKRPWAYLSPAVFVTAARRGIRYELAQRGIAHGGDIYAAQRELRFAFDDALSSVITGLAYDSNADGAIDANEARSMFSTIQAIR